MYPILLLNGEQDSAKTWSQNILRRVIDPNVLPVGRPAKTQEDLMIAAKNNWIVSSDNMSGISNSLSDDLCNIATGGGISKRKLYSDSDEYIVEVCRPIILNGIEDIARRADLLDRSIPITLRKISKEKLQPAEKLAENFEKYHPRILGGLLDAVVKAVAGSNEVVLIDSYRMAGFAKWAVAGLGDEGARFQEIYRNLKVNAAKDALEGNKLAIQIRQFVKGEQEMPWVGTATELLDLLTAQAGYDKKAPSGLPKTSNVLSGQLRRLAPSIRSEGIEIAETTRDIKTNARRWKIEVN